MTEKRENRHISEVKTSQKSIEEAINRINYMDSQDKKMIKEMEKDRKKAGRAS